MAKKVDLKKCFKVYYSAKTVPEIVDIPNFKFLSIEGSGSPESEEFQHAVEAIFSVSFKIKFISKKELNYDYVVMPLEGLWWTEDMENFKKGLRDIWKWKLMILQPERITQSIIDKAIHEVIDKKAMKEIELVNFIEYEEGQAAQILHVGPFSSEGNSVEKLHRFINNNQGEFDGHLNKHHEIYLSDFRRVEPDKMKTILRQPFTSKGTA